MKKLISLSLSLLLCLTTLFSNGAIVNASEIPKDEVSEKISSINSQYDIDVQVKKDANEKEVLKELCDLEKKLHEIDNIKKQTNNTYNIELPNPSNSLMIATTANNVGFYQWNDREILQGEGGYLAYDKNASFNYSYELRDGYYRFEDIFNVSSDVTSIDDPLVIAGLMGWVQKGYTVSYYNSNKNVSVNVMGHYQLGLNYDFISIGVKKPFSNETWTINIRFQNQ